MKRGRSGYVESPSERAEHVKEFIQSLRFSVSLEAIRQQRERRPCPKCGKRRLLYCYDCLTVVHPETHPAPLVLPLNVYVVLHPQELRGKSTSLAASTISPDLHIVEYPTVPEHLSPNDTLVLYPSSDSVELQEVEHLERYQNVVFVDSTWQQSKSIARDTRISQFKHVRIATQTSLFWRFQNNDPSYLATVEAIYYFLREYITQTNRRKQCSSDKKTNKEYNGEVDDLLLYYIHQYIGVQQRYSSDGAKFTDRHFSEYILPGISWESVRPGDAKPQEESP